MSKRIFTPEDQDILRNNPNVASCSEKSITFTPAFKQEAVRKHHKGMTPQSIFATAGLSPSLIGRRTPNERLKKWTAIAQERGVEALLTDGRGKHDKMGRKRIERVERYRERVRQLGLQVSMSRRGNCIDNASMESFFGHFKDDLPQTRHMHFQELQECVDSHIMQYNTERKQWGRNKMTPVEYRDHLLYS